MTEDEPRGTLVVLTTNSRLGAAQVISSVLDTIPEDALFRIVVYGDDADSLASWASRVTARGAQVSAIESTNRIDAVNKALVDAPRWEYIVLLEDDVRLAGDWLGGLKRAVTPVETYVVGDRVVEKYGPVGIVSATSDQARFRAQRLELNEQEVALGLDKYTQARSDAFASVVSGAEVVEGFCTLLTAAAVEACQIKYEHAPDVLNAKLGEWAWPDLCLRANKAGLRVAVSEEVFVARTTVVPRHGQEVGSLTERLAFYGEHPTKHGNRVIATMRVRLKYWRDLVSLRKALESLSPVVQGVALLLMNHPDDMQKDTEDVMIEERLVNNCHTAEPSKVARALERWADRIILGDACAAIYEGEASDSGQRNALLDMAEGMRADAVLVMNQDEILEGRITEDEIQRILRHPNPLVQAFNVGIVHHWDSDSLVREDHPWGHGGKYTGAPSEQRLYRTPSRRMLGGPPGQGHGPGPAFSPCAVRIAAIRMRRHLVLRQLDRDRLNLDQNNEAMRMAQWDECNGIGLHMLVYSKESAEDVARWLDDVHAVMDRTHLVWTDDWDEADKGWVEAPEAYLNQRNDWPTTGPSRAMATVAYLHDAFWVHEPLEDNLAQARNAGIVSLAEHSHTLKWALFVDPDEWFADPIHDVATLRTMACSSRWGWLLQVANYRDNETPTVSDSIRMSRLDEGATMRMNGRVHEGFDAAIHQLQAANIHPRLIYAPFVLQHRGMGFDVERMTSKLDKYEGLLRLELEDNPHNPGAWVSLGWHYYNDGHEDLGRECYQHAIDCAGNSYLPFKEMSYVHLRAARDLMEACNARLTSGHQFHKLAVHMRDWLRKYAPPHPVIERTEAKSPAPLPEWVPPAKPGTSRYDET